MKIELPKHMKLTKKEKKEIDKGMNSTMQEVSKSFLNGLFFFITAPIQIYNKIKSKRRKK